MYFHQILPLDNFLPIFLFIGDTMVSSAILKKKHARVSFSKTMKGLICMIWVLIKGEFR